MFSKLSKLLLVLGIAFGYGSNLTLKTPQKTYDIVYDYDSSNNDDFYYYNLLLSLHAYSNDSMKLKGSLLC